MTWEERMAAKAKARREAREAIWHEESRLDWEAQQEEWIQERVSDYTPESAAAEEKAWEENPMGCACVGGSYCCIIRREARNRVIGK